MVQRPVPFDLGPVHFIGIGGIGLSGIAEILLRSGYVVQGSDARASANTERLIKLGARIFIGHDPANVEGASAIVYSTAVKHDNPEMLAGRDLRLPLVRRAEMLAELMRLQFSVAVGGTHGKTTTTSMIACLLDAGGMDPTVVNGGIINAYGTNAKVGEGEWIVVEADESDGTFLKLKSTVAVVTNIDPEHLDHYGEFDAVKRAFQDFVENIPFYGFAVVCTDHPEVQAMAARVQNRRLITYGTNPQAQVRAINMSMGPEGAKFDVAITPLAGEGGAAGKPAPADGRPAQCAQRPGRHRRGARAGRVSGEDIAKGLRGFGGVRRRFTTTGTAGGVRVIDDYGHHPVEIAAVLKAARAVTSGRVVAVVQPHRYSRLRDLFGEFCSAFNDADVVIVADVYAAGEAPLEGFDRDSLVEGLRRWGHRRVLALEAARRSAGHRVRAEAKDGDLVAVPRRRRHHRVVLRPAGGQLEGAGGVSWRDHLPPVRGKLLFDEPLAPFTWFRVGGPADVLFLPADADDLAAFLRALPDEVPRRVLGVGSNVIVRDGGVEGVVVRLAGRAFAEIHIEAGRAQGRRRRGRARRGGRPRRGQGWHRRPGVLRWRSGHHRRRADHERRLLRRRDQGRAAGRLGRRPAWRAAHLDAGRPRLQLSPQRRPGRCDDLDRRPLPGLARRSRRHQGAHGRDHRPARGRPADPRKDRRFDLQESAGRFRLAAGRRGRLARPVDGRRQILRTARQLPDQHRRRDRRRSGRPRRGGAGGCAGEVRRGAGMGDQADRAGRA